MKVLSSLICLTSIQDEASKNISIINVIDQLNISLEEKPLSSDGLIRLPFTFEVVTHLYGNNIRGKTYQVSIETRDPKDKLLNSTNHDITVPEDKSRFRLNVKITGITLSESGEYNIRLVLQEKKTGSEPTIIDMPLDVKINYKKV